MITVKKTFQSPCTPPSQVSYEITISQLDEDRSNDPLIFILENHILRSLGLSEMADETHVSERRIARSMIQDSYGEHHVINEALFAKAFASAVRANTPDGIPVDAVILYQVYTSASMHSSSNG